METLWFILVALMLTGYAVLDGFDLGAGALHLIAGRTDDERRAILQSIGPVWDGNEVWLLAAGGTLLYAFPLLYASSFSGFYLALNVVLWLLVFRAIGIEFRMHLESPLWRDFFDVAFSAASILLLLFYGAALGNVMRGVPLGSNHYFFVPLWTDFRPGPQPGILDWYTILCALVTLVATSMHGALYVILKSEGQLNARMRTMVKLLLPVLVILSAAALLATVFVNPALMENYRANGAAWLIPALVALGIAGIYYYTRTGSELKAFLSSCLYVVATLGGAAMALYPTLLPATTDAANAITIRNAAAGHFSLTVGLIWWGVGMAVAIGYFVLVYTMFKGKVHARAGHY
jgi:cytochrome d ubiquinol oxidase subunit II